MTDIGRAASQVDNGDQINPEPAVTDSYEVGARLRVGGFSANLAAYIADSELAARTSPVPALFIAEPLRQPEQTWGVEADWSYVFNDQFDFGGVFNWADGERTLNDGSDVPLQNRFVSPTALSAYGNWRPTPWFDGRVQMSHTFESNDFNGSTANLEGDFDHLTLVDVLARFKDERFGAIELGVDNLFNVVDVAPGDRAGNNGSRFFPFPGRTISLTYRYEFQSR